MKKKFFIGIGVLFTAILASCDNISYITTTLTSETTEETVTKTGMTTTQDSSLESTVEDESSSTSEDEALIDSSFSSGDYNDSSYSTGNWGESSSYNYGYYRTYYKSSNFIELLKKPTTTVETHPSCVYNLSPYKGIKKITLNYMSTSDFYIYTSLDKSYSDMHTVPSSSSYTTITITCDASSYYKICSSNSNVYIKSLTLSYNNTTNYDSSTLTYSDYRINMSDFYDTYTPTNGTIRTIPSDITVNSDGTYTVNEYKTYTYASYSYAISQSNPDLYAYTDPVDVANYYMLFHTWPVNYVDKKKVNSAKDYFTSSNVRCVSEYSRTNGYATAVPYYYNSGFVYYELDLDLYGTYSTSSRGVGRLVVWKLGFDATNYDSNPVIVYTDDHYATFKEYLNYGQFGTRFNAETSPTSYSWCNNVTLVK